MTRVKLAYVHEFTDRHGKVRRYVRRHGKRVPLPGLPGSTEFNDAYARALDEAPAPAVIGVSRTLPGSVNAMIVGYLGSAAFHHLAPTSQTQYGHIFENMRQAHGDKSIAKLERRHVVTMLDAKAATPIGARDFLRCLRLLIAYAISTSSRRFESKFSNFKSPNDFAVMRCIPPRRGRGSPRPPGGGAPRGWGGTPPWTLPRPPYRLY
jgi:hypothetical protein